jgi:hypothetical protein
LAAGPPPRSPSWIRRPAGRRAATRSTPPPGRAAAALAELEVLAALLAVRRPAGRRAATRSTPPPGRAAAALAEVEVLRLAWHRGTLKATVGVKQELHAPNTALRGALASCVQQVHNEPTRDGDQRGNEDRGQAGPRHDHERTVFWASSSCAAGSAAG